MSEPEAQAEGEAEAQNAGRYWRENVKLLLILLSVWFLVSFGAGILFVDQLNAIRLGGFPLGFWFAQQGSIMVFVLIILTYCILLNRLDKRHHDELEQIEKQSGGAA